MKKSSFMRKIMVLMMVLAVVVSYSVVPMNQSFAASGKRPAKVKSVKATALNDSSISIKVSWKKAKSAKKYQVYMATKKKGKFKKIGTTKKLEYVKASLKDGKKYYFKVRAVNGKKKGAFSKIKSATAKYVAPAPAPTPTPTPTPTPDPEAKEKDPTFSDRNTRTMTTTIDMSAEKYNGSKVRVWVPVPQSNDEQGIWGEVINAPKAAVAEFKYEPNSGYNNRMLYLEWDEKAAAEDRTATLTFNVSRYKVSRTDLKEDPDAPIPSNVKKYITEESTYVVVNNELVKKYADIATEGKTGTLEKARAIYEWCINNLERIDNGEYLESKNGKWIQFDVVGCGYGDTVQILKDYERYGRAGGHCTDINSTFVALCRAAGIPAREMFGIRLGDSATGGQHCWAQFYLPGTGWTYADPGDVCKFGVKDNKTTTYGQRGMSMEELEVARNTEKTKEETAKYWGSVDNNRVELSRGRDVILEPAQHGDPYNTFGYPCGEFGNDKDGYTRIECTAAGPFHYEISCTDGPKTITSADLRNEIFNSNSEFKVLDVRKAESYAEAHIPGAVSADVDGAVTGKYPDVAKANIAAATNGDAADTKYVLVCYTGNKYANAAKKILGEKNVPAANIYILAQDNGSQGQKGGMAGWTAKYPNYLASTVKSKAGVEGNGITAENLEKIIADGKGDVVLLDVREESYFDNGHIAGALNLPSDTVPTSAGGIVIDSKTIYVPICHSGNKYADNAQQFLEGQGVPKANIIRLIGGMNDGWADRDTVPTADPVEQKTVYVTPQWLKSALAGEQSGYEKLVVLEVSYGGKSGTYASGHVPGAIQVAVTEVEDGEGDRAGAYNLLDADQIRDFLKSHGITSDTKVVMYDAGGDPCEVGRQAYGYLAAGMKDVKILDGHLAAWTKAGYKTETKSNTAKATTEDFGVSGPLKYWTSIDEARAKLDPEVGSETYDPNFKAVSIRSEKEWLGETSGYSYINKAGEPRGAVWGRGADSAFDVNGFLHEDGTVLTYEELKTYWIKNGCNFDPDSSEQHLAFYCGTGWRATVPFLIMYQAGKTNMSVFDGGWYEWLFNGDYPVQVGDPSDPNVVYTTVKELPADKAAK